MVRHIFGIFLTRRPISANILRDDEFEGPADIAVGQERRGKVGKNSWEEGKILKTGTKTSLLKVKVLPSGELLEGPAADSYTGRVLGTRAKERALLKAAANSMPARTARLQEINSSILDDTLGMPFNQNQSLLLSTGCLKNGQLTTCKPYRQR
ncbi:Autophagy-related protein 9 [Frankliniella fusca]|uniref:Autophagy-related protein 9 n=1 Tax=Frankliniella fusca TaxID=407009 RepID=A0AAE1H3V2_9NEOP|nr:Autophagy-related protein 9 [Frankliniella fusca]